MSRRKLKRKSKARIIAEGRTPEQIEAANRVAELVGPPRKKRSQSATKLLPKWLSEVREMLADSTSLGIAWKVAEPHHFVALYVMLHSWCYGVTPSDLTGNAKCIWGAVKGAGKMLKEEFEGDQYEMFRYVRWAWKREKWSEQRRRERNQESTWRLGWRYMFCYREKLIDYRIAVARKSAQG